MEWETSDQANFQPTMTIFLPFLVQLLNVEAFGNSKHVLSTVCSI